MKKSLADRIEQYIKVLIARSEENQIIIQRMELAETFCCVPSQVTYVISTRFTEKTGYTTESRRGGKGYIRITLLDDEEAGALWRNELFMFIDSLLDTRLLSENEGDMLKHLVIQSTRHIPAQQKKQFYEDFRCALDDFTK